MKRQPDLRRPKREATPKQKALAAFLLSGCGILAGIFYFIPQFENVGVAFTMLCAVLAGIFYTRYSRIRREERKR